MIIPQWLELPLSRNNFHGPKNVRGIEVRLYLYIEKNVFTLMRVNSYIASCIVLYYIVLYF